MDRERINPAGVFKHGAFMRVVTVKGPMKLIFIAGQTPTRTISRSHGEIIAVST
jgi:hypothetical protein